MRPILALGKGMSPIQKSSNTMGVLWFLLAQLYWGWLAYIFFSARLFSRIISIWSGNLLSVSDSRRILILLVLFWGGAGFLLSVKYRRNSWAIAANTLPPYGIYLILETIPQIPIYIKVSVAVIGVLVVLYSIMLITAPIHHKRNRSKVVKKRCAQLVYAAHGLSCTLLCILTITSAAGAILGISVMRPQIAWDTAAGERADLLAEFSEELSSLQDERWKKLTLQQKIDLMQLVAQIESGYLGLPDELMVCCETLQPNLKGSYEHENRTVRISQDHLLYDGPADCVRTILHEVYHSYQYHLCSIYEGLDRQYQSMYFLRDASNYMYEFEHYTGGSEDFSEYYNQQCETDSRAYADSRLLAYYQQVQLGWELSELKCA